MIRKLLAFSALCLIVGACGDRSSLGSGGDNIGKGGNGNAPGDDAGAYQPCANKPCGAECNVCPPNDPECAETAVLKFCDEKGSCGQAYPQCSPPAQCQTPDDCPYATAPCEPCPDGSYACTKVECISGQCVVSSGSCNGAACQDKNDCPAIGAPCQLCPDGSTACPFTDCVNGQCVGGFPGCPGYEPCAGKQCGDSCTQCPPNDPECAETAVLKFCDSAGACQPGYPTCGGGNECKSPGDCPVIAVCQPCADGTCAQPSCNNGKCELTCPTPKPPECTSSSQCPQIEICKQCQDGSCAQIACLNGQCEFVCGL